MCENWPNWNWHKTVVAVVEMLLDDKENDRIKNTALLDVTIIHNKYFVI